MNPVCRPITWFCFHLFEPLINFKKSTSQPLPVSSNQPETIAVIEFQQNHKNKIEKPTVYKQQASFCFRLCSCRRNSFFPERKPPFFPVTLKKYRIALKQLSPMKFVHFGEKFMLLTGMQIQM